MALCITHRTGDIRYTNGNEWTIEPWAVVQQIRQKSQVSHDACVIDTNPTALMYYSCSIRMGMSLFQACSEVDWLTALRYVNTERILVPRNVAK